MTPDPIHLTDLGNSERFVRQHHEAARYCYLWKCFLRWDGTRWARDLGDGAAELAKQTTRSIYAEAGEADSADARKAIAKWAMESEKERTQRAMLALARSALVVKAEELDQVPRVLNCPNGTLELATSTLRAHRPTDWLTKLCPTPYVPDATCPNFKQFLTLIFADNQELITWLQTLLGYTLLGHPIEQLLVIAWGGGSNGKSTLLTALRRVLGLDYVRASAMSTFLLRRNDGIPNDLAALVGARLVIASESGKGRQLDEAVVKQLTGGDQITARFLHAEYFSYDATFTILLSTNDRPEIHGTDHAIWRRIRLVPFTHVIPDEDQQKDFFDRTLLPEAEGILAWLVQGCAQYLTKGLGTTPTVVTAATAEYRTESDVLGPFLEDRCDIDLTNLERCASTSELYAAYLAYCKETRDQHPITKIDFGRRLGKRGLVQDKGPRGLRLWGGIRLRLIDTPADNEPVEPVPF